MSSLYHPEYYSYTNDAQTIDRQASAMAKRIIEEWTDAGYSPREISQIIQNATQMEECEFCLTNTSKVMKAKRKMKDAENKTPGVRLGENPVRTRTRGV